MKAILITNPEKTYLEPLKRWIDDSMARRTHNQKERKDPNTLKVISSPKDLMEMKFLSFFSDNADTHFVFIVPELNWPGAEDEGFDAGYKVALSLMTDTLGERFFNLVFVSSLMRYQLKSLVSPRFREFIHSCPHVQMDELPATAMTPIYSRIHFELIRRVITSATGRIDYIKHSLNSLGAMSLEEARDEIRHILDMLSMDVYSRILPDSPARLDQLRSLLAGLRTKEDLGPLKEGLDDLAAALQDGLVSEDGGLSKKKSRYKVLIVDDNPDYREKLRSFFSTRFSQVDVYDDAALRRAIVRREQDPTGSNTGNKDESLINTAVGRYNLIILDLMFKESDGGVNRWLDFNGFDLYKAVRDGEGRKKSVLKAAIRIVTSLPRNEVSILSGKYLEKVEAPKVFTKGKDWNQLQACLIDRMDEILEECAENERNYEPHPDIPPMNGVLGHAVIREGIKEHAEAFRDAVEFAKKVAAGNGGNQVSAESLTLVHPTKTKATTCDQFIEKNLTATLVYRRLLIGFAVHNPTFTETTLHAYLQRFISGKLPSLSKNLINSQLGFTAKWGSVLGRDSQTVTTCTLSLDNLFEEEKDLLEEDYPLEGGVGGWASKLLRSFVNPCDDDEQCRLRLEDIYDAAVCGLMDGLYADPPRGIHQKGFTAFLRQSLDFILGEDNPDPDREYIQDTFTQDEVSLEEKDNREVARILQEQYPKMFDLVTHIVGSEI